MGDLIKSVTNFVGDIGNVAGDVMGGNFNKLGTDLGKAFQDGLPLAIDAAMIACGDPEMLAMGGDMGGLGGLTSLLGGLQGSGGGFNLGNLGGFPPVISPGNFPNFISQNPLGTLFPGGAGGGGYGIPGGGGYGIPGGGFGGGTNIAAGVPNFNQLTQGMSSLPGGDPTGSLGQLQGIDAGAEAFQLAVSKEQVRHQEMMTALKAMGQAMQA